MEGNLKEIVTFLLEGNFAEKREIGRKPYVPKVEALVRFPPLERYDKGSQTRLGLLYFCDPSAWRQKPQLLLLLVNRIRFRSSVFVPLLLAKHQPNHVSGRFSFSNLNCSIHSSAFIFSKLNCLHCQYRISRFFDVFRSYSKTDSLHHLTLEDHRLQERHLEFRVDSAC